MTTKLTKEILPSSILTEVKENHNKLDKCSYHKFSIKVYPERVIGNKWICEYCGGEVDSIAKLWYERGQIHEKQSKYNK